MIKIFLDANVLFAAAYSRKGGSFEVINLAKKKKVKIFTSRLAIKEAEKNLREKAGDHEIDQFYTSLSEIDVTLINIDSFRSKGKYGELTGEKDAPILAAAIKSGSKFLITLDKKHLLSIALEFKRITIVTPGDFIEKHL